MCHMRYTVSVSLQVVLHMFLKFTASQPDQNLDQEAEEVNTNLKGRHSEESVLAAHTVLRTIPLY